MLKQIELFPKQLQFLESDKAYTHFCGGIGSGKSFAGAVWMVRAILQYPDNRVLITARDFPQLRDATLVEFKCALELFGLVEDQHYTYNKSIQQFVFFNKTVVVCTGMNNSDSALRGPSYGLAWCDEAEFYDHSAWLKLKGRMRRKPGQVRITSSPNGYNHMWEEFENKCNSNHEIIRATSYDNFKIMEDNPNYVQELKDSYSPKMFAQEVLAERVALNMYSVYEEFDREVHVQPCKHLLTHHDQLFCFLDYNIHRYPGVYMFQRAGKIYAIGEEYLRFGGSRSMAKQIKTRFPEQDVIVVGDQTGNNKADVAADYSNYEIFAQEKVPTMPFQNPPVESRIINANSRLYHNKLIIDPSCEVLIKDLEQVCYDEHGKIDKKTNIDLTHISDAYTYGVWFFMPLRKKQTYKELNLI